MHLSYNEGDKIHHLQYAFLVSGKVAQQEVQVELSIVPDDFQMQWSVNVKSLWSKSIGRVLKIV